MGRWIPAVAVALGITALDTYPPVRAMSTATRVQGTASPPTCRTGAPGERHEEPGHAFAIIFRVQAPCEFGRFVSQELQDASDRHNKDFSDTAGRGPLTD